MAARLLRMSLPELGVRGRQALWKVADRLLPSHLEHADGAEPPAYRAPIAALDGVDAVAAYVRRTRPDRASEVVREADRILGGEVELLGLGWQQVGTPPEWTREPISGRVAPARHWSRIRYLDPAEVGDSKVVWELNRHQHLLRLAQAYRLTGERRYADGAWFAVASWIAGNRPGWGINWCSSLEVALRAIAWCWLWRWANGPALAPAELQAAIPRALAAHARHIEKYLSRYFAPNTHLTGEALGLCYIATSFPDLGRGQDWWRLGSRILTEAIESQIHADGVHFERSTCYQLYTLDFFTHFGLLHKTRGEPLPPAVARLIGVLADATSALREPGGLLPGVGDDDGGRLLGPLFGGPRDPSVSLAAAAALRDPSEWLQATPVDATWLLGVPDAPIRAPAAPSAASGLRVFAQSGFVVARSGRDDYLLVSAGVQLSDQACLGHVHDDAGSVVLWSGGQPVWVDPGTLVYSGDLARRNWYRSAAAHSTALVDGNPPLPQTEAFQWARLQGAELQAVWQSAGALGIDLLRRVDTPGGPVTHRRRIVGWPGAGWVVWDRFEGEGTRSVTLRFQLAPGARPAASSGGAIVHLPNAVLASGGAAAVSGERRLTDAMVSPTYGAVEPAVAWSVALRGRLPFDSLVGAFQPQPGCAEWIAVPPEQRGCSLELRSGASVVHRIAVDEAERGPQLTWRDESRPAQPGRTLWLGSAQGPARITAATMAAGSV